MKVFPAGCSRFLILVLSLTLGKSIFAAPVLEGELFEATISLQPAQSSILIYDSYLFTFDVTTSTGRVDAEGNQSFDDPGDYQLLNNNDDGGFASIQFTYDRENREILSGSFLFAANDLFNNSLTDAYFEENGAANVLSGSILSISSDGSVAYGEILSGWLTEQNRPFSDYAYVAIELSTFIDWLSLDYEQAGSPVFDYFSPNVTGLTALPPTAVPIPAAGWLLTYGLSALFVIRKIS